MPFTEGTPLFDHMKSMTGFGRGEVKTEIFRLSVEIASVNRKQMDIVISLPREWSGLETDVRRMVEPAISRGRVQVQFQVERMQGKSNELILDEALCAQYVAGLRKIASQHGLADSIRIGDLLRAPGVFSMGEVKSTPREIWPHIETILQQALDAFSQSRGREGMHIHQDLTARLALISDVAKAISSESPKVAQTHREQMHKRLADAGLPCAWDDERLLKEVAIFADRCDLTEEVTRLQGHVHEFRRLMDHAQPQGRALDFLTQELHRELNTMGSKANSTTIAHLVVTGKTEVERIREQIQNVE